VPGNGNTVLTQEDSGVSGREKKDVHKFIRSLLPGETFHILKEEEEKQFDEYRTGRLALEAWDKLDTQCLH
jgi:hypothetical protein